MRHQLFAGAALAALLSPVAVYAQETTSSIRGQVTADGAPIAGATVTVIHTPSGTRSVVISDAGGNFDAAGLRVGGPFTISVSASGYPSTQITDVQTQAGQP